MTILSADQRELFLPLVEGIHESPPWGGFLRNLVARTYARRAMMIVRLANAPASEPPCVIHVTAPRATQDPPLDLAQIAALDLHPYGNLRPERVYALDEVLDFSNKAKLAAQRAALDAMGIRYGRWLRIAAGDAADAWLVLVREREDFSASAVATLSSLAPHLAAALRTYVALAEARLRAAMAQDTLARLGVGQVAFDNAGRVLAADDLAERVLTFTTSPAPSHARRLQLLPDVASALDAACARFASDADGEACEVLHLADRALHLLLRPCNVALTEPAVRPAALGVLRLAPDTGHRPDAVRALRVQFGLSASEADLALRLAQGESLIEAGARLHLTEETTRNYSKRIYGKTGTSGQADLVRLVLTSLAAVV